MTATSLAFVVTAVPKPQGSKRAFVVKGRNDARARAIVVDSDKGPLKSFRDAVRSDAIAAQHDGWQPFTGPVIVHLQFAMPKPKAAERGPRRWPIGKNAGDVDKLARSVLDALTDAAVWGDDSQVVDLRVTKDYPETQLAGRQHAPGVRVLVASHAAVTGQPELPITEGDTH